MISDEPLETDRREFRLLDEDDEDGPYVYGWTPRHAVRRIAHHLETDATYEDVREDPDEHTHEIALRETTYTPIAPWHTVHVYDVTVWEEDDERLDARRPDWMPDGPYRQFEIELQDRVPMDRYAEGDEGSLRDRISGLYDRMTAW